MSKVISRLLWFCITTLCDWLTNSRHFLNQCEYVYKPKPIVLSPDAFSRAWRQLHAFASNSDWLVVLFTSVAIGRVINSVLVLRHSIGNRSISIGLVLKSYFLSCNTTPQAVALKVASYINKSCSRNHYDMVWNLVSFDAVYTSLYLR